MQPIAHTTVPLGLWHEIDSRRPGMRTIFLEQQAGRAGWRAVPGARWGLELDGKPPEPGEEPSESTDKIAETVWDAAKAHRQEHGGHERFQITIHFAKKDGTVETHQHRFSVPKDDGEATDETTSRIESEVADFMSEMRSYIGDLHKEVTGMHRSTGELVEAVGKAVKWPAEVLPGLLSIYMQSIENRMLGEMAAEGGHSKQWKESAAVLKDVLGGPFGKAIAKEIGFEDDDDDDDQGGTSKLQRTAAKLGKSITSSQKMRLLGALGSKVELLEKAKNAKTDAKIIDTLSEFFDALDDPEWEALEEILTETQSSQLTKLMELIEQAAAEAAEKDS